MWTTRLAGLGEGTSRTAFRATFVSATWRAATVIAEGSSATAFAGTTTRWAAAFGSAEA
jgi:hypothetical protein